MYKRQFGANYWKQFLFTDECSFKLGCDGHLGSNRKQNEKYKACYTLSFSNDRRSIPFGGSLTMGPCAASKHPKDAIPQCSTSSLPCREWIENSSIHLICSITSAQCGSQNPSKMFELLWKLSYLVWNLSFLILGAQFAILGTKFRIIWCPNCTSWCQNVLKSISQQKYWYHAFYR